MSKLLNKIKLIIAPYLYERSDGNIDFVRGKIELSKAIADEIDCVNKENLRIDQIDEGEVILKEVMIGTENCEYGCDHSNLLLRSSNNNYVNLSTVPYIPDENYKDNNCAGYYEVTIKKVKQPKENIEVKRKAVRRAKKDNFAEAKNKALEEYLKFVEQHRHPEPVQYQWFNLEGAVNNI